MAKQTETISSEYDTVVVGAGPAGIMAARGAAQRGAVLLLEASSLPRDKSCGGMLHQYSQDLLGKIAPVPTEIIRQPEYVHFRYVDWDRGIRRATRVRFLNVDRQGFDDWLLWLLPDNVDVAGSSTVTTFHEDAEGVVVTFKRGGAEERVRCNNMVGSDGGRSAVRRTLGEGSVSTYITLQDFCRLEAAIEPYFDCVYMRDIGDCFAYSYIVPKSDVAIVGSVYYPKTKRPHEKQDLTMSILRESMPQLGDTVKREASTALHLRTPSDIVPGRGRVLLVGEAGGFMSPTSGEGISYAMNSGLAAGEAIAASSPTDALQTYSRSVEAIAANIRRKLRLLPLLESSWGKYLAGFVPSPIINKVTERI